jgi:uncharacterized protein YndB with AHSA1/START domain
MTQTATDGTVETRDGTHVVRFERALHHSVERVWAAITEPDELVKWLGAAELDLVPDGRVQVRWLNVRSPDDDPTILRARVTEVDPPYLLEYEGEPHGVLRFELREAGEHCVLTFTSTVAGLTDEQLLMNLAGWNSHLDHLVDALDNDVSVDWWQWYDEHYPTTWQGHYDRYKERYAASGSSSTSTSTNSA